MAGDLKELFPHLEQDDLAPIIAAIAGHHGKPPDGHYEVNAGSDKAVRDPELGAACVGVARAMFGRVRELIEPGSAPLADPAPARDTVVLAPVWPHHPRRLGGIRQRDLYVRADRDTVA